MEQYKAVILDIDGTIVPVGATGVSRRVVDTVNTLRRAGVKVIVATGRSAFVLNPHLLGDFTADYYVCVNGSLIMDAEHRVIWETRLTPEQMNGLDELCRRQDLILGYTFEDGYYIYRQFDRLVQLAKATPPPENPLDADPIGDGPLDGFTFDGAAQNRHQSSMPFGAVLHGVPETAKLPTDGPLSYVMFHPGSYDVYRADLDKARTTARLLDRLGIGLAQAVAIGDGNNDVPLLSAAGLGVAMGNGRPAARAAANMVCGTVEEDGAALALERIFSGYFTK